MLNFAISLSYKNKNWRNDPKNIVFSIYLLPRLKFELLKQDKNLENLLFLYYANFDRERKNGPGSSVAVAFKNSLSREMHNYEVTTGKYFISPPVVI